MAWVGQCRIAFKVDVDGVIARQQGRKSIIKALKQFARESGVPFPTLQKWYYQRTESKAKNGLTQQGTENVSKKGELEKAEKLEKTHGGKRKGAGRKRQSKVDVVDRDKTDDGPMYDDVKKCTEAMIRLNRQIRLKGFLPFINRYREHKVVETSVNPQGSALLQKFMDEAISLETVLSKAIRGTPLEKKGA